MLRFSPPDGHLRKSVTGDDEPHYDVRRGEDEKQAFKNLVKGRALTERSHWEPVAVPS